MRVQIPPLVPKLMGEWIIQIGTVSGLRSLSFESSNLSLPTNYKESNMVEELYITVPVTDNFNTNKVIGSLSVLKSELPKSPNFVFSLGFKALDCIDNSSKDTIHDTPYTGNYELVEVSIVHDTIYHKYLQQIGY